MITALTSNTTTSVCYLLDEHSHVLLIDPNDFRQIQDTLLSFDGRPELILLTHEHFDHITALEEVRESWQIPVIASRCCSDALTEESENLSNIYDLFVYFRTGFLSEVRHEAFRCRPADIVFDETYSFRWQDHLFELCRCPGHSPGSCVILMDQEVLFSGDYLIPGEKPNLSLRTSCTSDYEAVTRPWLSRLPDGLHIYPGHGSPYTLTKERNSL